MEYFGPIYTRAKYVKSTEAIVVHVCGGWAWPSSIFIRSQIA